MKKSNFFDLYGVFIRILCIASLYLCICSFFLPFVLTNQNVLYSVIVVFGGFWFYLLGYFLQYMCSLIFGFKRAAASKAYESDVKHFKLFQAIIPMALSLGVVFLYSFMLKSVVGITGIEDALKNALVLIAPLGAVSSIGGCVIWFYPTERVVSEKTSIIGACTIFISYVFFGTLGIYVRTLLVIMILYIFCMAITLSYSNMTRNHLGTVVSFINKKSARYSFFSALIFLSVCLACFAVTATITSGITVIFKSLLFFILNSGTESNRGELGEVSNTGRYNLFVYGNTNPGKSLAFYFFIVFVICLIAAIVYFAFRKNKEFKAFLAKVKEFFENFFAMIRAIFGAKVDFGYDETNSSYMDVERKVQQRIVSSKKRYKIPKNYKSFCDKLESIEDDSEKIIYSYVTLIEVSRVGVNKLKKSDTPREIAKKLKRDSKYNGIDKITEAFEIVAYATEKLDPNIARSCIDRMQNIIRVSIEH